jgi:hypothetical protein
MFLFDDFVAPERFEKQEVNSLHLCADGQNWSSATP